MGKAAVLKIGTGNFKEGFEVTLQICPDDAPPSREIQGRLPGNSDLEGLHTLWSQSFRSLTFNSSGASRGADDWEIDESITTNRTTLEGFDVCRQSARRLESCLREWLQASESGWSRIRENLREELAKGTDDTRLIIQSENTFFGKLPWQVWDLLEDYPD
ncbi:hypothetical protein IQ260_30045, partial [Leptolyngbya cf. ectocarpi LEGE 11479]|nr:hypothetical protein [Leptolyngbya cf. ectocarpi LEGE 11479]